jgi:hypothetical protein
MPLSLCELRWHWGDAYRITGTSGHWKAERRDDGRAVTADDLEKLRQVINADYATKPVPRDPLPPAAS